MRLRHKLIDVIRRGELLLCHEVEALEDVDGLAQVPVGNRMYSGKGPWGHLHPLCICNLLKHKEAGFAGHRKKAERTAPAQDGGKKLLWIVAQETKARVLDRGFHQAAQRGLCDARHVIALVHDHDFELSCRRRLLAQDAPTCHKALYCLSDHINARVI
eukprot:XP_001710196.1 Hypothetical protein GL50803_38415 [Giardia lamblia ATCC 50803]